MLARTSQEKKNASNLQRINLYKIKQLVSALQNQVKMTNTESSLNSDKKKKNMSERLQKQ